MVEHHLAMVGVAGSNPVFRFHQNAGVAAVGDGPDLQTPGVFYTRGVDTDHLE